MRSLIVVLLASALPAPGSRFPAPVIDQPELIERTLALVGGQPITLSDARAAIALGLVEVDGAADPIPGVTARLIDRELVLREVQRYAPPTPGDTAVEARLDEIRQRLPNAAALARILEVHGFTAARLRAWVRDDLRTQAYLAQRFASASTPTDAEIALAYATFRTEFDQQGLSFAQAAPMVRDRLVAARRRELITDWLSDLRRRTDVVILQQ